MTRGAAVAGLLLAFTAGAIAADAVPARTEVLGFAVDTTVDSAVARYYLEVYLRGRREDPALDARLDRLHAEPGRPTRERLAAIAQEFSTDVAAAFFAWRLLQEPANRDLQTAFIAELRAVRKGSRSAVTGAASSPLVLFAPGWLYRTQPETGADFARPRQVLAQLGMDSLLIPTAESGTIEENARIIADELRRRGVGRDLILVSASKAGPEAGWALTLLEEEQVPHAVKAWVNIGGILQGSPLADAGARWPLRWGVALMSLWKGWTLSSIDSMRTAENRARFARWRRPAHTEVINLLAVPLSGQVTPGGNTGYERIRSSGPNDGLTLLPDAIAPGSSTLVQLGLDHYFLDPEIDLKTVALARLAAARVRK